MARKLRIAVSMLFGVLTVVLCVMWVRSYWVNEIVSRIDRQRIATTLGSNRGWTYAYLAKSPATSTNGAPHGWQYSSRESIPFSSPGWRNHRRATIHWMPYALIIGLAAMTLLSAWHRPRFSLRTLLIATTLVALALAFGVWLAS